MPNILLFIKLYIKSINIEENIKKKVYLVSSISSLYYFGGGLLYFISSVSFINICSLLTFNKNVFEPRLYYFLLLPFFSKIILKSELFRHQILSLFISIIGIIFLFIPISFYFVKSDIIFNILEIISSIAGSFVLVMVKHLTHKYFLSPYFCLLFIGLFSLIILLFGFIIYYSINNLEEFKENFYNESPTSVIYLISIFIFGLNLIVLSYLVIFYFSPTLLMVTDIINPIINWIISLFQNEKEYKTFVFIFNIIGYSILLFSSLIFNEIIILNFFGLNRNTKTFIEKRQIEELTSIIDNDSDDKQIKLKNEIDNIDDYK